MKHKLISAALILCISTLITEYAMGEKVRIPIGEETRNWASSMPSKGQNKAQVEAEFGSPNSKTGPRGQPPIYFWEYPDFTVYFEYDYVIHTVVKNKNL